MVGGSTLGDMSERISIEGEVDGSRSIPPPYKVSTYPRQSKQTDSNDETGDGERGKGTAPGSISSATLSQPATAPNVPKPVPDHREANAKLNPTGSFKGMHEATTSFEVGEGRLWAGKRERRPAIPAVSAWWVMDDCWTFCATDTKKSDQPKCW